MTQPTDPDQTRYDARCGDCGEYLRLPGDATDAEILREWENDHEHCGPVNLDPPPQDDTHNCVFNWCINGGETLGADLEHMSAIASIPATGTIPGHQHGEILVSLFFQEDLDLAPGIAITAHDGAGERQADLRISEAVILHARLGRLIEMATAGTNFNPARIVDYVDGGPQ